MQHRAPKGVQKEVWLLAIQWIVVAGLCLSLLTSYSLYREKQQLVDLMNQANGRLTAQLSVLQPDKESKSVMLAARNNPKPTALEAIQRR